MKSELRFVRALRRDARLSVKRISEEIGISRQSVMRKLRREHSPVLKCVALADFRAMGYSVHALMLLNPKNKQLLRILKQSQGINSLYVANSFFPLIAYCIFRGMKEYSEFESSISPLCRDKRVHFVVEEVKQEDAFC